MIKSLKNFRNNDKFNYLASRIYNFYGVRLKNKGSNNKVNCRGTYLLKTKIEIVGSNNSIKIGNLSDLRNCSILIIGNNHDLSIGEKCQINNTNISFTQTSGKIMIGDKTTIGGAKIYSGEGKCIELGEDCMLSSNIEIRTTDSHSIISLENNKRTNKASDIYIGKHVWLGNSCRIWKGANIGNNSVIGFGATVSKSIESNSLAVGTPANVKKKNITWTRQLISE
ncbi:acyltransferase [Peribacillus butanolivorans]|uniref:acyltransferase n=1 Tax=Peribacillus butanolivorans TaxID=421767 RepID=UPI003653C115